ncbi:unnamed protein product, partial [marine sediment metagenome]
DQIEAINGIVDLLPTNKERILQRKKLIDLTNRLPRYEHATAFVLAAGFNAPNPELRQAWQRLGAVLHARADERWADWRERLDGAIAELQAAFAETANAQQVKQIQEQLAGLKRFETSESFAEQRRKTAFEAAAHWHAMLVASESGDFADAFRRAETISTSRNRYLVRAENLILERRSQWEDAWCGRFDRYCADVTLRLRAADTVAKAERVLPWMMSHVVAQPDSNRASYVVDADQLVEFARLWLKTLQ